VFLVGDHAYFETRYIVKVRVPSDETTAMDFPSPEMVNFGVP
jgi:hypothetical protein